MPQLRVLISGGGVAGTALAFWLSKLNHDVTVVEHFPTLRTTGLQIDLRGDGITVLKRMGLEQAFRAHAAPEEGMQFVDHAGRNRAYFAANRTGKGAQGITSDYEIMRGDLCRIIHDATGASAKYVFGTLIASFRNTGSGVDVTFKDGSQGHWDLLVGCDGAFSATRKMMLGGEDSSVGFTPRGEYAAYLTYKKPAEEGERYVGMLYIAPEKRCIMTRRHNPEEMQLYLMLPRPDERLKDVRRGDVEAEKKAFAEIYEGAGWKTPELIQRMKDSDDFYCERLGMVKLDSWSRGNVTLLGDAGFATGGSGIGTTCAMVGAYVLAGEISKHCGRGDAGEAVSEDATQNHLANALKSYEENFRPYVSHIQKGLEKPPNWLTPSSAWGIEFLHMFMHVVVHLVWLSPIAMYFTREKIENWTLPEYEGLPAVQTEEKAAS